MIIKTLFVALGVVFVGTTLAQAGVVFSDDFNRPPSSFVGNGWVETEFGASDARIISNGGSILGAVQLENAAVTQQVSTLGLFSNMLEFDYAAVLVGGTLSALLSLDNTVYTALWTSPQLSSGTFQHVALYVPQADNQADVWFRFQTSGINGAAQVDNVMVSVPEPATLTLFGLGLLGLGAMRRKKRRFDMARTCAVKAKLLGVAAMLLMALSHPALANVVTWQFSNVTMEDGASVNGSFVVNTATQSFLDWSVSIYGGDEVIFPSFTWNPSNSFSFFDNPSSSPSGIRQMAGFFSNASFNAVTPSGNHVFLERLFDFFSPSLFLPNSGVVNLVWLNDCYSCSPYRSMASAGQLIEASAVPEPSTLGLIGLGLLGLGAMARRRRCS